MRKKRNVTNIMTSVVLIASFAIMGIAVAQMKGGSLPPKHLHQLCDDDFRIGGVKSWRGVNSEVTSVKLSEPIAGCDYALRFKPKQVVARLIYQNDFFMTPGTVYELSFWYKSVGKPGGVYFVVGREKYSMSLNPSSVWQNVKLEIHVPPEQMAGGIAQFRYSKILDGDEMMITAVSLEPKGRGEWLSSDECFARLEEYMRPLGWTARETTEAYVLSRGMICDYFAKKEGTFPREKWATTCYLGRETTGNSFQLKRLPLGFYMYLGYINNEAKRRGIPWKEFYEQLFANLRVHNVTTMVLANTGFPVPWMEGFTFMLDLAQKHDIQLILQPSHTYFRTKKEIDKKKWLDSLRCAEKLFEAFNSHPALLAWCFREEVAPCHASLLSDYYRYIGAENIGSKPVFICNNRVPSANYPFNPMPQIMAFDRYCYKYIPYLGRLLSPSESLKTQASAVNSFLQAAISSGRPLIHVGLTGNNHCRQLMESENVVIDPKAGWVKDAEKGWNGTTYYYPPKYGMRAQVWCSIASGAKGFLGWYYRGSASGKAKELIPNPKSIDYNTFGISCDRFGNEPPEYAEIGDVFGEIKRFEPYILNMNKRVLPKATTKNKQALLFTHQMTQGGEYILALVNTRLGKVDPNTGYYVDAEEGRMKGVVPDGPQEIEIELKEDSPVYDLKNQKALDVKDGKFSMTLEPGEGTLLLLGDEKIAQRIIDRTK